MLFVLNFSNTNTISPEIQKSMTNPNPELPEDIILNEILPRLPAKSLVRFKSVCRQWKTIISRVEFAKIHLHHPSFLSSTRSILTLGNSGGNRHLEAVDLEAVEYYDADPNANSNNLYLTNFSEQFRALFSLLELSASCNGLAFLIASPALKKYPLPYDYDQSYEFSYVIYNPVLGVGDYVEIPHPRQFSLGSVERAQRGLLGMIFSRHFNFGFGYYSKSDDYYIVAVDLRHFPGNVKIVLYVYSLRSHHWETYVKTLVVKDNGSLLLFESIWKMEVGTLVKETLHWAMSQGYGNHFILAYALDTRNVVKKMYLPQPRLFGNVGECGIGIVFKLCCLGDCLGAWANYRGWGYVADLCVADLWMMKEYGVWESWTNLFRIQLYDSVGCLNFFGFTNSGMVLVFTSRDQFFLVDFTSDLPNISGPVLENKRHGAVDYNPSLVSVLAIVSGLG